MVRAGRISQVIPYALLMAADQARQRVEDAPGLVDGAITYDQTSKSPAQAMLPNRLVIVGTPNTPGAVAGSTNFAARGYELKDESARLGSRGNRG